MCRESVWREVFQVVGGKGFVKGFVFHLVDA